MYVKAIEQVNKFTRPVHTISRNYDSDVVYPGTATLFFVNEDGYAVTCKHVAEMLAAADDIEKKYLSFQEEKKSFTNQKKHKVQLRDLEKRYGYNNKIIFQLKHTFMNCVDKLTGCKIELHPTCDLALLKFEGFNKTLYKSHAVFLKETSQIKQGKNLCRLGYPFPEFNNYKYNDKNDDIEWTREGRQNSPSFPIDGIVTRQILGSTSGIIGIEISTPGLRGQSGGPLFDNQGIVYGMQSATGHLHLGFDIENKEVVFNNSTKKVTNQPFLNVGHCVHADIIKDFLKSKKVKYYEEELKAKTDPVKEKAKKNKNQKST